MWKFWRKFTGSNRSTAELTGSSRATDALGASAPSPQASVAGKVRAISPHHSFLAHSGKINCVSISDEGFRAVSAGEDGELHFWNISEEYGKHLWNISVGIPVKAVCYLNDDTTVAALLDDGTIRYYEMSGHLAQEVDAGSNLILKVFAFRRISSENNMVIFAGQDLQAGFVRTSRATSPYTSGNWWNDIYLDDYVKNLIINDRGMAVTEDGQIFMVTCKYDKICAIDFSDEAFSTVEVRLDGDEGELMSICCDGDRLYSGHAGGTVSWWDLSELRCRIGKLTDEQDRSVHDYDEPDESDEFAGLFPLVDDHEEDDEPEGEAPVRLRKLGTISGLGGDVNMLAVGYRGFVCHDSQGKIRFVSHDGSRVRVWDSRGSDREITDLAFGGSRILASASNGQLLAFDWPVI